MERFKRYFDGLLANYRAITNQLQSNTSLTSEIVVQLREKQREIRANLQLLQNKFSTATAGGVQMPGNVKINAEDTAPAPAQAPAQLDDYECRLDVPPCSIQSLASEVNDRILLNEDAKSFLFESGEKFLQSALLQSIAMCKHRRGTVLSSGDVRLALSRIGKSTASPHIVANRPMPLIDTHKQRLQQAKKAQATFRLIHKKQDDQ